MADIRAVVTGGGTGLLRDWFDELPNVGLVAINGVGTDKVDLDFELARARSIYVSTTPDVLTDDVVDIGGKPTLRRAGLDVFEGESELSQRDIANALLAESNVVGSAHATGSSAEALVRTNLIAANCVVDVLEGRIPPQHCIIV